MVCMVVALPSKSLQNYTINRTETGGLSHSEIIWYGIVPYMKVQYMASLTTFSGIQLDSGRPVLQCGRGAVPAVMFDRFEVQKR